MTFSGIAILGVWTIWLTPVWLLGAGTTLALLVLLVIFGLVWLVSRQTAMDLWATLKEGVLLPISYLALFLAGFTVIASLNMPTRRFMESVQRVMGVGEIHQPASDIPPRTEDHAVAVKFRADELKVLVINSNQDVIVSQRKLVASERDVLVVEGGETYTWKVDSGRNQPFHGRIDTLYVTNESDGAATVQFDITTDVEYPQVYSIPVTTVAVVGLYLIYFLVSFAAPKLSAIAAVTAKEATSQPIFYLALAMGAFALVVFIYIPYNTFGEDVKMLKGSGLTLIMVLSIVVALWTASVSVADEIEGRTALTLLSKPISRRQFILGKFLGIIWPILLMFVLLGFLFLVTVSYKVVYDARETAAGDPDWQQCFDEMVRTVPGLVLAFMETVVMTSISVAISTRLPMLANLIICSSVYVLGHLGPMIVNSAVGKFQIVEFVGRLIATLLPVLDHFNIQAAIAAGARVPSVYLAWALVYCVLYSSIAMLLALAMFEDRDLA